MELLTALEKISQYSTMPTSESVEQRFKRLKGIADKAIHLHHQKQY